MADKADNKKFVREIQGLVNAWNRGGMERSHAETRLKELGPDAISIILKDLAKGRTRFRRGLQIVMTLISVAIGLGIALYIVLKVLFRDNSWIRQVFIQATIQGSILIRGLYSLRNTRTQVLGIFDDVRVIPAIAAGLEFASWDVRRESKEALKRLLPKVQLSDEYLFDAETLRILNETLLTHFDLALPILSALRAVGDGSSLPFVERLAARNWGRSGEGREIGEAASALIPVLCERADKEKVSEELLRAAEAPGGETLLRPVSESGSSTAEMLLRPYNVSGE